jgi:peptide deformylase
LLGHPVLRGVAAPVADPQSREIRELIDDMRATLAESGGVGIAAPQVYAAVRVIIVASRPTSRYPDAPLAEPEVLVNPEPFWVSEEMEDGWEGCLSVPDMRGMVPRYTAVRLQCLDREGQKVDVIAKDFFARVCQHETDHLNGRVYLDRMRDLSTLSHIAEWNKHWLGIREQDD